MSDLGGYREIVSVPFAEMKLPEKVQRGLRIASDYMESVRAKLNVLTDKNGLPEFDRGLLNTYAIGEVNALLGQVQSEVSLQLLTDLPQLHGRTSSGESIGDTNTSKIDVSTSEEGQKYYIDKLIEDMKVSVMFRPKDEEDARSILDTQIGIVKQAKRSGLMEFITQVLSTEQPGLLKLLNERNVTLLSDPDLALKQLHIEDPDDIWRSAAYSYAHLIKVDIQRELGNEKTINSILNDFDGSADETLHRYLDKKFGMKRIYVMLGESPAMSLDGNTLTKSMLQHAMGKAP